MTSSVYFAADPGRIKIGFSKDVPTRLRDVGAHLPDPLILIATIPGDSKFEHAIHDYLGAYRIKKEWFRDCAEVRNVIAQLVEKGPAAIGFVAPPKRAPVEYPPVERKDGLWGETISGISRLISNFEIAVPTMPRDAARRGVRSLRDCHERISAAFEIAFELDRQDDPSILSGPAALLAHTEIEISKLVRGVA